jgi:type IV pilus assembly protein PilA
MLQRLWERRRDDEGFTLIELMVVVLIIGILIAIALPTFLGARQRAQDRGAQSDLRNAMAAAKAYYTEGDTYAGLPAEIANYETSLDFITGASTLTNQDVSVDVSSDGTEVGFARMSASGTCFWIMDDASGSDAGTYYGTGETCTGEAALAANGSSW